MTDGTFRIALRMYEKQRRSDRIQMAFPIRVRGMSVDNKFFDEETATRWLSKFGLMTRLRNLVDLETEVHVTNLRNAVGGTFRAVWVNTRARDGFHDIGLEVSDVAGDMWGIHSLSVRFHPMNRPLRFGWSANAAAPIFNSRSRKRRLNTSAKAS